MWIAGLRALDQPLLHLHTQFNEQLPWSTIDMDCMNLNQAAHGDREFGFITARMRSRPKMVVGFWGEASVHAELGCWIRAACAWHNARPLKAARFGDNTRNVAVTDGNKVSAEINLRYAVNGYGVGDLGQLMQQAADAQINDLVANCDQAYRIAESLRVGGSKRESLRDATRIEIGLRKFLDETGSHSFPDTLEDLHGLKQLPRLAGCAHARGVSLARAVGIPDLA
jgi:L-arabinose isomerase